MTTSNDFQKIPTTAFADFLPRKQIMSFNLRPIYSDIIRIAGPAFTVHCGPGDNLMLHAAIYRAPAGSIIIIESADMNYAVAGGNVCAVAQKNGIAGFIIDGAIRDLGEIRKNKFPVFAKGIIPIPGKKNHIDIINDRPVTCGDVLVHPGDIVVADEEGIVVIPQKEAMHYLKLASSKLQKDESESLETWEKNHRAKIESLLK